MTLGERLQKILDELPDGWSEARVIVTIADAGQADRAAAMLGSLAPGRAGATFLVTVTPGGSGGPSPDATRRVLDRLDREGIDARLTTPQRDAHAAEERPSRRFRASLAECWDDIADALPADWSDLYLEVELASSVDTDRAALLLAPANPFLHDSAPAQLRFRAARRFGYGASPQMTRRVLARLDEDAIHGELRVLRVLCESAPVLTQGPVWRDGGRAI